VPVAYGGWAVNENRRPPGRISQFYAFDYVRGTSDPFPRPAANRSECVDAETRYLLTGNVTHENVGGHHTSRNDIADNFGAFVMDICQRKRVTRVRLCSSLIGLLIIYRDRRTSGAFNQQRVRVKKSRVYDYVLLPN